MSSEANNGDVPTGYALRQGLFAARSSLELPKNQDSVLTVATLRCFLWKGCYGHWLPQTR